jgi:hypothetical protein
LVLVGGASVSTPERPLKPFPDRDAIKRLIAHRELFLRPPEELSWSEPVERNRDGVLVVPLPEYSKGLLAFIDDLYALGFVARFDWPAWQEVGERIQTDPSALQRSDLTDLVKLLTIHARKERFCDGHWSAAIHEGWFAGILDRLAEIDAELDRSPESVRLIANRDNLVSPEFPIVE